MGRNRTFLLVVALVVLAASSEDGARLPLELPVAVAPPAVAPSTPAVAGKAPDPLAAKKLRIPVKGVARSELRDTFHSRRGVGRTHRAIDIMAPWGTPVLAADDGRVAKISSNRAGGLAVYQVDATGRLVYYYAHLAGYADDLREGQQVRRGDVIGYVGATGNAPKTAPHLHFQVLVLAQEKRWWGGEAVNPYAALSRDDETVADSGR